MIFALGFPAIAVIILAFVIIFYLFGTRRGQGRQPVPQVAYASIAAQRTARVHGHGDN